MEKYVSNIIPEYDIKIERICPYCGSKLNYETYKMEKGKAPQCICYCDNDNCSIQPCTDAASASDVYQEILAITGDKK